MAGVHRGSPSPIELEWRIMRKASAYLSGQLRRNNNLHSSRAVVALVGALTVALALTTVPSTNAVSTGRSRKPSAPRFDDHLAESYGKLPLSFEPNRGQMDSKAKFIAHG